jgi:hypothetical protein
MTMKQLKKEMKDVLKDLKQLTKRAERIATKLDKLEKASKAKPAAKPKAKKAPAKKTTKAKAVAKKKAPAKKKAVAKRGKAISASDTILKIIQSRKTPIDTATLKKRTGFKDNNIRMIVYRLKKRGEIKSVRKGVYQKA